MLLYGYSMADLVIALKHIIDPKLLIEQFGYIGLFCAVFAESGLMVGFFLPGDSLLLIAGVLASQGVLHIGFLIPLIFVAAFAGDQVGYWTGNKYGRKLFKREDSRFFRKQHLKDSEQFFARFGTKTVILARFVPIVRTFTPILAGVANMPYKTFMVYNLIGALLWGIGITLAGYLLGNIPFIDKYIHYVVGVVIILSLIPVFFHLRGTRM